MGERERGRERERERAIRTIKRERERRRKKRGSTTLLAMEIYVARERENGASRWKILSRERVTQDVVVKTLVPDQWN